MRFDLLMSNLQLEDSGLLDQFYGTSPAMESLDAVDDAATKSLLLRAVVPEECFQEGASLGVHFYALRDGFRPLQAAIRTQFKRVTKRRALRVYSIEVDLPVLNEAAARYGYHYSLLPASSDQNRTPESLLVEGKQLRQLATSSESANGEDERIDGLVLFGSKVLATAELKADAIGALVPVCGIIGALRVKEAFSEYLDGLERVWRQLVKSDAEYSSSFRAHLEREFLALTNEVDQRAKAVGANDDSGRLMLLAMFYCSHVYRLKLFEDAKWLDYVFGCHQLTDATKPYFVTKLDNFFEGPTLSRLNKALEAFLEANSYAQNPVLNGVNAALVYFFLNRPQSGHYDFQSSKLARLIDSAISPASDQLKNATALFQAYRGFFDIDKALGPVVVNYFALRNEQFFSKLLADSKFNLRFLVQFIKLYASLKPVSAAVKKAFKLIVKDIHAYSEKAFEPLVAEFLKNRESQGLRPRGGAERAVNFAGNAFDHFVRLDERQREQLRGLQDDVKLVYDLLKHVMQANTGEAELIVHLIELCLRFADLSEATNMHADSDLENSFSSSALRLVKRWLRALFQAPLWLNYGLNPAQFTQSSLMQLNSDYGVDLDDYDEAALRIASPGVAFEARDEPEVYKRLLRVQVSDVASSGHFKQLKYERTLLDQFRARLEAQVGVDFRDFVVVRLELLDFKRFGSRSNEFERLFDETIISHLVKTDKIEPIQTLCSLLRAQQPLLEAYMNNYLSRKRADDLAFVLEWANFSLICELDFTTNLRPLSKKWRDEFVRLLGMFADRTQRLADGTELVGTVKAFSRHIDNAKRLLKVASESAALQQLPVATRSVVQFERLVAVRKKEVDEFERYRKSLTRFLPFCQLFAAQIDTTQLRDELERLDAFANLDQETGLNALVATASLEQLAALEPALYRPRVLYFAETDNRIVGEIETIVELDRANCVLFDTFFRQTCAAALAATTPRSRSLRAKAVVDDVWPKVLQEWQRLADRFDKGQITLADLEAYLAKSFAGQYTRMLSEFSYWLRYLKIATVNARTAQIELYGRFRASVSVARSVDEIRGKLGIREPFPELADLLELNEARKATWTVLKMTDEIGRTVAALDEVRAEAKLKCLQAYVESARVVKWLQKNCPSLPELKVFVDLVLSSAENNDGRRLQLAMILKDAGTAFASLIYAKLTVDCTFSSFIAKCKQVMHFLASDRGIADKLRLVNEQVDLLESIKNMQGNVEANALAQTKRINATGTYYLARPSATGTGNRLRLTDVVRLETKPHGDQTAAKRFSYEQLKEHQSVLTLIASGRSKADQTAAAAEDEFAAQLDRFVQVFEAVSRAAETFVRLVNSGCSLFKDFAVEVRCRSADQSSVFVRFGASGGLRQGRVELLHSVCGRMDECLAMWTSYIDELRCHYGHLNYFTMSQLEFLKAELAGVLGGRRPANLSAVKALLYHFGAVSVEAIRQAFERSIDPAQTPDEDFFDHAKYERLPEPQNNAATAGGDAEVVDKFGQAWTRFVRSQKLKNSDEEFMDVDEEPTAGQEAITIEGLAVLFRALESSSTTLRFARTVPDYLVHRGEPNLIVCSNAKAQIPVTLSIYAQSSDRAPLPSDDEILFCSAATSREQVENFVRVACRSTGERIYCLVNAHELSYETSSHVEAFLSSNVGLQRTKTSRFVFVCICCQSSQSQSILSSMFARNRVKPIELGSADLEDYLRQQLSYRDAKRRQLLKLDTAVKALVSYRSGNGKSSYVREFMERLKQTSSTLAASPSRLSYQTVRIKSFAVDIDQEAEKLIEFGRRQADECELAVYHIDVAFETFQNVDLFLFNLVVCGCLRSSSSGLVWRRDPARDLFFVEMTSPYLINTAGAGAAATDPERVVSFHAMINFLPKVTFNGPARYLYHIKNVGTPTEDDQFARTFFEPRLQRTCFYLRMVEESVGLRESATSATNPEEKRALMLDSYNKLKLKYSSTGAATFIEEAACLETLLRNIQNESCSWMELANFVRFLNTYIDILEQAVKINKVDYLPGVVLHFLIIMARDFSLSSLRIEDGEEAVGARRDEQMVPPPPRMGRQTSRSAFDVASDSEVLFALSRLEVSSNKKWESMVHPLLIFNADNETLTFMGCYVDRTSKNFINPATDRPIEENYRDFPDLSAPSLYVNLMQQGLSIFDNFNRQHQTSKIKTLAKVLGIRDNLHLLKTIDVNYVLTVDNCIKLMAVYLRLKCNNPVVLMGETGCGKTSLVKFFTDLYLLSYNDPSTAKSPLRGFLVHAKIHGGTSPAELKAKLREAVELARDNARLVTGPIKAVLFFDEANTTEAVGLVKEIMCDLTCDGEPVDLSHGLKIIAAVNPYRKHSDAMIGKLEHAGLGFYVSADSTRERLGQIPMRHLVYRVQPLPSSLIPLVWDFGQLERSVEDVYVRRMVERTYVAMVGAARLDAELNLICQLLGESQQFMRARDDECSFVSLRNIQRALDVAAWFLGKRELIFARMNARLAHINRASVANSVYWNLLSEPMRAVVLSLSVCYHAGLYTQQTRKQYRQLVRDLFPLLPAAFDWMECEILACQHVFFDAIALTKPNIARNGALLENVFMMVVCIELRIPLFIVGKPGSSKSLAKSIVADAMEGVNSRSDFFQRLKETYFINFQCSPLTTSEMIVKAFREAASFQRSKDLERSVAVVNLDEIGLAEGSESMPLKALHSLLEEGVSPAAELDQAATLTAAEQHRVGVIGISNWALDPAKMNRGIMVSRGEPDVHELEETAKGICNYDLSTSSAIQPHLAAIAAAYLELCEMARQSKREFFGLRDFYSLIKMLYWFCSKDKRFTWHKLEHAVRRNFGGLDIDVLEPFRRRLSKLAASSASARLPDDPSSGPVDLVRSALKSEHAESNSRYLLFITENETAIDIIQSYLITKIGVKSQDLTIIFGSSFRADQQYSEICRNISLIKNNMEMGKTVILLNSYNLYESLYDALNQYYSELAGLRYVHLGLGTNRVKCPVHANFRLIMIAEKAAVYDSKRFPIPLVNRLEKHFINSATMIEASQRGLVDELDKWASAFVKAATPRGFAASASQLFVGWDADTTATLVMHLTETDATLAEASATTTETRRDFNAADVIERAKRVLLRCATADSVVRFCSDENRLTRADVKEEVWTEYFVRQGHLSLFELLAGHLQHSYDATAIGGTQQHLLQVTTHAQSSVLNLDVDLLAAQLDMPDGRRCIDVCLLKAFDTQQQFAVRLADFLRQANTARIDDQGNSSMPSLLVVQCDMNNKRDLDLITCARHVIVEETKAYLEQTSAASSRAFLIVLVVSIPKEHAAKFIGFQVTHWTCYHLDELDESSGEMPALDVLKNKSIRELLAESFEQLSSGGRGGKFARSFSVRLARTRSQLGREKRYLNLRSLLKRIGCTACSLIVDTNMSRTIARTGLFAQLCHDYDFLRLVTQRLLRLLEQKEAENQSQSQRWLAKEAASLHNINAFSTLRRSCQNYFESKLSPLLAYILASVDVHANLDIYYKSLEEKNEATAWKRVLWIGMLEREDLCVFDYRGMLVRVGENDQEQRNFACKSELVRLKFRDQANAAADENQHLRPRLPFSWVVVQLISSLHVNNAQRSRATGVQAAAALLEFSRGLSEVVAATPLRSVLAGVVQNEARAAEFLDSYIHDFVLTKCRVSNQAEFGCLKRLLGAAFAEQGAAVVRPGELILSLAVVHYLFAGIERRVDGFLRFSALEPRLLACPLFADAGYYSLKSARNYLTIDLDACLLAIDIFQAGFRLNRACVSALCGLLQLISSVFAGHAGLAHHYERLSLLRFFVDFVVADHIEREQSRDAFEHLIQRLIGVDYFARDFSFKTKPTLLRLVEFVTECRKRLREVKIAQLESRLSQFLLNALEAFCFSGAQRPEVAAIEAVLDLIVREPDQSSAVPTAAHRPLILQLIFKDHHALVKTHVKAVMERSSLVSTVFRSASEIALFYQNCVQDFYHQRGRGHSIRQRLGDAFDLLVAEPVRFEAVLKRLKVRGAAFDVDVLDALAKLKYALSLLAEAGHLVLQRGDAGLAEAPEFAQLNARLKLILDACLPHTDTLHVYLSRQVIRRFGSDLFKLIRADAALGWTAPESLVGGFELASNKFFLGGAIYDECDRAVLASFHSFKATAVMETLAQGDQYLPYMAMALYRNVTLMHGNGQTASSIFNIYTDAIAKYEAKIELAALVYNRFTHRLRAAPENVDEIELASLLVQLKFCLLFSKSKLAKSLADVVRAPRQMRDAFLPTMPQDETFDIRTALRQGHETTTFYACPNGHPYVVGNCGRPMQRSTCKECGAAIGGENHNLDSTNRRIDETIVDKTLRGYCLPAAASLPDTLSKDRLLNSEAFHAVRFFLHASLYLGCGDDGSGEQEVKAVISKGSPAANVKEFFWAHLKKDLRLLAEALKLTQDEVVLLLHRVCFDILQYEPPASTSTLDRNKAYGAWPSKSDRQVWEIAFFDSFFRHVFAKAADAVTHANFKLKESAKNSEKTKSKFYMIVWELMEADPVKTQCLYEHENFWKFRPTITFDTLRNALQQTDPAQHQTLKSFAEMMDELESLQFLPEIVQLVSTLHAAYNKTLFRQNARNVSVAGFLSSAGSGAWSEQVEAQIASLDRAWKRVQPDLSSYVSTSLKKSLQPDMTSPSFGFNRNTKLSFFLPTLYGDGFACYALLHYQCTRQNRFLDAYHELQRTSERHAVAFEEFVNRELVVQFDREKQLIPLLHVNAFINPETMRPEFVFENIESQVVHKFARAKALVNIETIPVFEYSDELQDYGLFEQLESVIRQESFDEVTQFEVFGEFKRTTDISEALNYLKIVMNYAYTTHAKSDEPLGHFLGHIFTDRPSLKAAESALKLKIVEKCRLAHLKHLITLLSVKRSLLLTLSEQDPFESVSVYFKAETSIEWSYSLEPLLHVSVLVALYQIIHLKIVNMDEEDLPVYGEWRVRDVFTSLDSLSRTVIRLEHMSKLPASFPDPEAREGDKTYEPIKMSGICALWKVLVKSYKSL